VLQLPVIVLCAPGPSQVTFCTGMACSPRVMVIGEMDVSIMYPSCPDGALHGGESIVDESIVDESIVDESIVDESIVDESIVDESIVDDSTLGKSIVDESTLGEYNMDESTLGEPTVDELAIPVVSSDPKITATITITTTINVTTTATGNPYFIIFSLFASNHACIFLYIYT